MKLHNFEQCSPEWFAIRSLRMTASHAQAIATAGKGLETYIYSLMAEHYSTFKTENFSNEDIERGNELEQQARDVYEFENDVKVEQVGFAECGKYVGFSPDGFVGKDGGIEIKCLNNVNHFKMILTGKIESKYLWQIQMTLFLSGRKWWDFVAYNPNFEKNIIVIRVLPDEKAFEKIEAGLKKGEEMIKDLIKKYNLTIKN
jgi:putative phage-type endonuclease